MVDFKNAIRQFVNGTSGGGSAPMQIGAMGWAGGGPAEDGGAAEGGGEWAADDAVEAKYLAALASTVCYGCGQKGHLRANCPNGGKSSPWQPENFAGKGGKFGGAGGGFGGKSGGKIGKGWSGKAGGKFGKGGGKGG